MGEQRRHRQDPLRVLPLRIEEWTGGLGAVPWRQGQVKLVEERAGMENARVRRLGVRAEAKTPRQNGKRDAPKSEFKRDTPQLGTKSHSANPCGSADDNVNDDAP